MPSRSQETERRPTILILSAGSLLGQNILDALEPRRSQVRVIGADANAESARLFRCDAAYLTPRVDDAAFQRAFLRILDAERPSIVFPGGDHDVLFLSAFFERNPGSGVVAPCGSSRAARIMQDKVLSFRFARENGLPFADTLPVSPDSTDAQVAEWLIGRSFPVLAKPRTGYGSIGVRLIWTKEQIARVPRDGNYLLQEFIGRSTGLDCVHEVWEAGAPWFFSIRDEAQYAGQTVICPEGRVLDAFCSISTMVMGRCEAARPIVDASMTRMVLDYAAAFSRIGWRGSFNIQLRREEGGNFKCHEFNGRMSGSTSARRFLGYDEIRLLMNAFLGFDLGQAPDDDARKRGFVMRSLTDYYVADQDVELLKATGSWRK